MALTDEVLRKLNDDIAATLEKFPGLTVCIVNSIPKKLSGIIEIHDDLGNYQGEFYVDIVIPDGYPNAFPQMFDSKNIFKCDPDRHMYNTKQACLEINPQIHILAKKGVPIEHFTSHYVYPFLCAQLFYEIKGYWPSKAWSHGGAGLFQFYSTFFEMSDIDLIVFLLEQIERKPKPCRTNDCICGSGKKYRKCHKNQIEVIYDYDKFKLKFEIEQLKKLSTANQIKNLLMGNFI